MRWFFAVCDLVTAGLLVLGLFVGVPIRYAPIDALGALVTVALVVAALALAVRARRAELIVRACSGFVLFVGLVLFALLAGSASHLAGVYGPIGKGSALILILVAALVVPYLLALPAAQLVWIHRRRLR